MFPAGRCEKEELDKKLTVPSDLNETTEETTVVNVACVRPKRYVLIGETSITCQHHGTVPGPNYHSVENAVIF